MKKIVISTGGTGGHIFNPSIIWFSIDKNDVVITSDNRYKLFR